MGAADDIKHGLTKSLSTFTKQRKAEEKHAGALRWRWSRLREIRGDISPRSPMQSCANAT